MTSWGSVSTQTFEIDAADAPPKKRAATTTTTSRIFLTKVFLSLSPSSNRDKPLNKEGVGSMYRRS